MERFYRTTENDELKFRAWDEMQPNGRPHIHIIDTFYIAPAAPKYLPEIAMMLARGLKLTADQVDWTLHTKHNDFLKGDLTRVHFSCVNGVPYKMKVSDRSIMGGGPLSVRPQSTMLLNDNRFNGKQEFLFCHPGGFHSDEYGIFLADARRVLADLRRQGHTLHYQSDQLRNEWKHATTLNRPKFMGTWDVKGGMAYLRYPGSSGDDIITMIASTQTQFFPMAVKKTDDNGAAFEQLKLKYGFGYDENGNGPNMAYE